MNKIIEVNIRANNTDYVLELLNKHWKKYQYCFEIYIEDICVFQNEKILNKIIELSTNKDRIYTKILEESFRCGWDKKVNELLNKGYKLDEEDIYCKFMNLYYKNIKDKDNKGLKILNYAKDFTYIAQDMDDTYLTMACKGGMTKCILKILDYKCYLNYSDNYESALKICLENDLGDEVIKKIISHPEFDKDTDLENKADELKMATYKNNIYASQKIYNVMKKFFSS